MLRIYVEPISTYSLVLIIWKSIKLRENAAGCEIGVLGKIPSSGLASILVGIMERLGFHITELNYCIGHLKTEEGRNLREVALEVANDLAHKIAVDRFNANPLLARVLKVWDKSVILLYLTKCLSLSYGHSIHRTVINVLVADTLSRGSEKGNSSLILGVPDMWIAKELNNKINNVKLTTYLLLRSHSLVNVIVSTLVILRFCFQIIRNYRFSITTLRASNVRNRPTDISQDDPTLLLIEEECLSMDRSIRTQPHWIFKNQRKPEFRTLILTQPSNLNINECEVKDLSDYNISLVNQSALYKRHASNKTSRAIAKTLWCLYRLSLFSKNADKSTLIFLCRLFSSAWYLAGFCAQRNVKAALFSEGFPREVDAVSLVATKLKIKVIGVQYSNMARAVPIMMSTADHFCVFSKLYTNRWIGYEFVPKVIHEMGYIFDSSFSLLQGRAKQLRRSLEEHGVKFVVGYFDEAVPPVGEKHWLMTTKDHFEEVKTVMDAMINDETLGVITKCQYQASAITALLQGDQQYERYLESKQLVELAHSGSHADTVRNIIFPAEVAYASDIVIGHISGATAGLEAALVGTRCILINPGGIGGENVDILRDSQIVFPNIEHALKAIEQYRMDRPEYSCLGDWSKIIDQFDRFRDGRAAFRLRSLIDKIMS